MQTLSESRKRFSEAEVTMKRIAAFALTATIAALSSGCMETMQPFVEPAKADSTAGAQSLKKLPRKQGERVAVTIYEFRSSLPNVSGRAATDMFKTALVHSGQFRVVERSRLNEGVVREKQLQQGGWASGKAGQAQLRGAQYVFEGTLSEANQSEVQRSGGVGVAGMQVGGGSNKDSIAIDVRIVDAASGDIVDAITVRKSIKADEASVSGVGSLLNTILAQRGKSSPYTPDVQAQQKRAEGADAALRAAIEEAVLQLSRRFEP
jgi:curli biogenesis system outer membrane secretion channel CsgG